jgi:hypothetical protein
MGACLVAALATVPATVLAAASGTLSVSPASTPVGTGDTFTVTVVARANVPISGAQTTLTFDRTRLQVTGIAQAGPWAADGASYAGFPAQNTMAATIAKYNSAGKTGTIAAFFLGGGSEPADTDVPLLEFTFTSIACGTSTLGIPVGGKGVDGAMIDGTPGDTYGWSVPVTSTSGSVVNDCPGATPPIASPSPTPGPSDIPTPMPTPTPTPQPSPWASPVTATTHITGTLAAGYLGLTAPASATIPLEWGVTNRAALIVQVDSNRTWTLSVRDASPGPDQGHMTSGSGRLDAPMTARVYGGPVSLETGGTLASGGSTARGFGVAIMALEQPVGGVDQPGTYGITLLFQLDATF